MRRVHRACLLNDCCQQSRPHIGTPDLEWHLSYCSVLSESMGPRSDRCCFVNSVKFDPTTIFLASASP